MIEIKVGLHQDKVYVNRIQIGYLYYHTGLLQWCFESSFDGQIYYHDKTRDNVIEYLFSLMTEV